MQFTQRNRLHRLKRNQAVRQARAAQDAYRISPSPGLSVLSFCRALAVLREYKRGFGQIGRRPYKPAVVSFEEGSAALERELDRLAAREALKPPRAETGGQAPPALSGPRDGPAGDGAPAG